MNPCEASSAHMAEYKVLEETQTHIAHVYTAHEYTAQDQTGDQTPKGL